ncbi:hypothetical protein E5L57_04165 [Helicobacter pylori]|nr:hypothetical protein E5L57_04165 [Helicobacter pylori]
MSALSISALTSFLFFIHSPYTLKDLSRYLALLGFYGSILTDIAIGTRPMVAP